MQLKVYLTPTCRRHNVKQNRLHDQPPFGKEAQASILVPKARLLPNRSPESPLENILHYYPESSLTNLIDSSLNLLC